ncbi:hypothetical protein ACAG96_05285 [Candidatus Izemoplasma sp. B36]|uniref:hypothetical protein n=1 Tax=Candidatus Izemoplasma sp. B36 TaxID=3242468 RepID=UPI00355933B9
MKALKRIGKSILVLLIILILFILVINIPIINFGHSQTDEDYSNWMSETLSNDQLIVDVAMLGAHDAFSNEIDIYSDLDPYNTDSIMQGFTGILVKGFIVKQSVTQISDVEMLLNSGVRYLDIRLSLFEDEWYTKHNYLSENFNLITPKILDFLENNPGELLILDFQHINGVDYGNIDDYQLFKQMLLDEGLFDYAYTVNNLSNTTYGEITNSGTESKVVIISKFTNSSDEILYYDNSIRSNWADSDDFDYVLDFLEEESEFIVTENLQDRFRVMQAVTTMQMNGSGILKALMNWSLVNRAKSFNNYLVEYEGLEELLEELPIIMVDYANSNSKKFNENIMDIIMDFNQNS